MCSADVAIVEVFTLGGALLVVGLGWQFEFTGRR